MTGVQLDAVASDRDDDEHVGTAPTLAEPRVASVRTVDVDPIVRTTTALGSTRFQLGEELGKGGMGRVVAAADEWLGRTVAIKQALSDDAAGLARFEREARITARLEHPAIVPIYDGGRDAQGRPYYVMRKIAGDTLAARIEEARDLAPRLALVPKLLTAVDAAAFAHSHRIIHRDIKPWNVLLGAYGETLLIDWGLARELGGEDPSGGDRFSAPNLTAVGHAMGTPGYMSPEQARGQPVDERTDVYALGATLWHLLAGRAVVTGNTASAWLKRVTEADVPLDELPEGVPAELRAIVSKATAPAERRYRNAGELAHDLRAFLDGRLVEAHAYTTRQLIARWIRRHRAVVIATAAALVATIGVTAYAFDRIVGERDDARAAREAAVDTNARINLTRAEQYVMRDPAFALATLRQIPATSPHLAKARDLASVAAANGIGIGVAAHVGAVVAIAVSRDGRWIASAGTDKTIQIHAAADGASRVVARSDKVPSGVRLAWSDDGETLLATVAANPHWVTKAIDVRSGRVRVLPAVTLAPIRGDRVRYIDLETHQLVEIRLSDGATQLLADDVELAAFDGELALIDGKQGLRVVEQTGVRSLAFDHDQPVDDAAISAALGRAAVTIGKEVIELELATSKPVWRRKLKAMATVLYADDGLWIYDYETATTQRGTSAFPLVTGPPVVIGGGLVASTGSAIAHRHGLHFGLLERELSSFGGHRASPLIAVGTSGGVVQWWPLAEPQRLAMPPDSQFCPGSSSRLIGLQDHQIVFEIDRATGTTRPLATIDPALFCFQVHGVVYAPTAQVTSSPDGRQSIRFSSAGDYKPTLQLVLEDGTVVRTDAEVFLDFPGGLARTPDRKGLVSLQSKAPVLTADAVMVKIWTSNGWIVTLLDNGRLLRRAPTGAVDTVPLDVKPEAVRVTADGTLWLGVGSVLWRAREGVVTPVAALPSPIVRVIGDGRIVALADRSLWTLDGVRPSMIASELGEYQLDDRVLVVRKATRFQLIHLGSRWRRRWRSTCGAPSTC